MADPSGSGMVDPRIFEDLQTKIDEDSDVRDQIRAILQTLERQGRNAQSILSRAHSTPAAHLIVSAESAIKDEIESIGKLASIASNSPYYKYNNLWTRDVQNVVFAILLCGWLGGMAMNGTAAEAGKLLTIEEVGEILNVPVNLKDRDAFHLTIEEYLQSLITLIEELARLAVNSVTLGDYQRPLQISQFVKDLHAGFQILNLKNDSLRRRSDSIKYNVKKIEDIVYDLSNSVSASVAQFGTSFHVPAGPHLRDYEVQLRNLYNRNASSNIKMPLIDPVTMSTIKPASQSAPAPAEKPSLPVELLPTDIARIFSQAHPALLLSAYYLRFPAFVADPVPTLLSSLLPLAIIQIAYTIICVPAVGTSTKPVKKAKPGSPKKATTESASANAFTVFYALLLSLVSVLVLAALQVLFGAPVTTHIPHTLLSSAHLALLAIYPLIYAHGSDGQKWREIASLYSPIDEVFGGALGCFLGAWIGAVPIPLDWDREWQKWPVTIVTGAYAGYVVGKMAGAWLLKGKRIEFD
ncbi:hypothetical protein G7Y89_g331 [Cudoniella acicularis]|uniref:Glycosylphosphatidylinositol anchor biosynthesis protein 11 n=1 Tax=Cudoniella acicularis TaxID=354080 RepID=A0A8H4RXE6_9HELO|nr:hypothetical protein G7Y89_g331 [Cudoniella acicularis]